jgi:uncharacterized protein (DUF427 family)
MAVRPTSDPVRARTTYGFFVTHIGSLSMEADPEWQAYRRIALEEDTLVDMETRSSSRWRSSSRAEHRKGKVMQQNNAATARPIIVPGPNHPITIEHNPNRVVVSVADRVIAQTRDALTLREARYPAVHYIPRTDVDMALLQRTDHSTYCPYKGDCAYFSIPLGGERSTNAVWTYEAPYAAVVSIKDHLAFYPDRVDAIEERP